MPAPGGVLVVDEAGMVGTRQLAELISLTQAHQMKLVLVGDPHQLPEIDAGGLFAALPTLPAATCPETYVNAPLGTRRTRRPPRRRCSRRAGCFRRTAAPDRRGPHRADHPAGRGLPTVPRRHGTGQVLVVASSRADARRLTTSIPEALLADGLLAARNCG